MLSLRPQLSRPGGCTQIWHVVESRVGRERGWVCASWPCASRTHTPEVSTCLCDLFIDGSLVLETKKGQTMRLFEFLAPLTYSLWLLFKCVKVGLWKHFWNAVFNNQVPVRVPLEKAVTLGTPGSGDWTQGVDQTGAEAGREEGTGRAKGRGDASHRPRPPPGLGAEGGVTGRAWRPEKGPEGAPCPSARCPHSPAPPPPTGIIDLSQVPHLPVLVPPTPGTPAAAMDRLAYLPAAPQHLSGRLSSSPLSPGNTPAPRPVPPSPGSTPAPRPICPGKQAQALPEPWAQP